MTIAGLIPTLVAWLGNLEVNSVDDGEVARQRTLERACHIGRDGSAVEHRHWGPIFIGSPLEVLGKEQVDDLWGSVAAPCHQWC